MPLLAFKAISNRPRFIGVPYIDIPNGVLMAKTTITDNGDDFRLVIVIEYKTRYLVYFIPLRFSHVPPQLSLFGLDPEWFFGQYSQRIPIHGRDSLKNTTRCYRRRSSDGRLSAIKRFFGEFD